MIFGLASLNAKLYKLPNIYEIQAQKQAKYAAETLKSYAKGNLYNSLKKKTSYSPLAETIAVEEKNGGYAVTTNMPYAKFVEFGTIFQSARPFMTLAAEQLKSAGGYYG
jgi:HK97 gp10 family phage protein